MLKTLQTDSLENWMGILVFEISSMEFGSDIAHVHVLHSVKQKLTSEGYLLYNGKQVPLGNLSDLLNVKSCSKYKYILIFESIEGPFGFGVDKLKEILPWNKKIFENEAKIEKVVDNKFLLGKIYFQGRTILLPDFDKIINNVKGKQYAIL